MREFEKRIQQYQAQLPQVRERVIAALLIFAFSLALVTMSAFAWVTLSVSPEVSGVTMSIAANGNLEVALARDILIERDAEGNPILDSDGNIKPIRDSQNNIVPIQPKESAIGDSLLSIVDRNLTWGNLINLSDASYGLDQIVLRPAQLNESSAMIKTKPFQSVTYGIDGRITSKNSDYRYTQWTVIDAADGEYDFVASDYLGVKAVSSVTIDGTSITSAISAEFTYGLERVDIYWGEASKYLRENLAARMESSATQTSPIAGLLSTYMNGVLCGNLTTQGGPNNDYAACSTKDIESLRDLMMEIDTGIMNPAGLAIMELFELYRMDTYYDKGAYNSNPTSYTPPYERFEGVEDLDAFCAQAPSLFNQMIAARKTMKNPDGSAKKMINATEFESLQNYINYRKKLHNCIATVKEKLASAEVILWKDIQSTVNELVNISTCEINGRTVSGWFGSLSETVWDLPGLLNNDASKNNAVIKGGLIHDIEMLLHQGAGLKVKKVSVQVSNAAVKYRVRAQSSMIQNMVANYLDAGETTEVEANVSTTGVADHNPSMISADREVASSALDAEFIKESVTAMDTYGLSIDFWIRSNMNGAFLTLEGEVLTEETPHMEYVTIDGENVQVPVYNAKIVITTTQVDANGNALKNEDDTFVYQEIQEETREVYAVEGVWYNLSDGLEVASEASGEETENDVTKYYKRVIAVDGTPSQKYDSKVIGYSGVNRIWEKDDLMVDNVKYSTSQGSGSCYTFYADPSETSTILGVLEHMYVVFVDINGNICAKAKLDTSLCYSLNGKHIVPLVLTEQSLELQVPVDDGIVLLDETDTEGEGEGGTTAPSVPTETKRAIMHLTKNQATFLTALIYLDGEKLSNKDVLSSSQIDGQFNIQFGTTNVPEPLYDEDLQAEQIIVSGSMAKLGEGQSFANLSDDAYKTSLEFDGSESAYRIALKVKTEGKQPEKIEAYFLRKISDTQGSRMEKVTLEKTGAGTDSVGYWILDYTFEHAGTYILRSVEVDGEDRDLTEMLSVTIPGFSVSEFKSETLAGHPTSYQYMTSQDMVKERFSLKMGANKQDEYPSSVRAIFLNENNIAAEINFSPDNPTERTYWTGNATFSTSGTYTLSYLILDGEYFYLGKTITREVSLGLKASVTLTKSQDDEYEDDEEFSQLADGSGFEYIFRGNEHEFTPSVKIYDNTGAEVRGLAGVKLYYTGDASADLKWDALNGVYSGYELPIRTPGVYTFQKLTVTTLTGSRETITASRDSDSITAIPSASVEYNGISSQILSNTYTVAGEQQAKIQLSFDNASASTVFGKFKCVKNGEITYRILKAELTETVLSANGEESKDTFTFLVPNEDGYWSLEEVRMSNVYDNTTDTFYRGDGTLSEGVNEEIFDAAESYYEITNEQLRDDANYNVTKVVKTFVITDNLGTANGVMTTYGDKTSTVFMTEHTISGIQIKVTDFDGGAIPATLSMKYTLKANSSKDNGGYTYAAGQSDQVVAVGMTKLADGTTYTAETLKLSAAGNYIFSIDLTFAGNPTPVSTSFMDSTKVVKIYSKTPSVAITSISPTSSTTCVSETTGSGCDKKTTYTHTSRTPSFTANSATVYIRCTSGESDSRHNYSLPTVTLTLNGYGSASGATLNFSKSGGGDFYISSSASTMVKNGNYTWTADGNAVRYIGYWKTISAATDDKTASGTMVATELLLTYGNDTYIVDITDITINNPY